MSKAIFFNTPTSGHINPTLPVVAELVRRGEQVIYYLTEAYCKQVEATGANFRPYASIGDDYYERSGLDGSNPMRTARTMIETTRDILPEILDILRAEKPDYMMYDSMCPWGWYAARVLDIPSVSSMSILTLTPGMIVQSGQLPSLLRLILPNLGQLRQFGKVAGELERTYGIKPPNFANFLNAMGTISLSYTSAAFQPDSDKLDKSIRFVGPAIEPRADASGFPFDQLDDRPLVYISLGTVINQNLDFYRACLRAFGNGPYQVVMSIGQRTDIAALGEIPANFIVRNHVPQLEILQRAALFITHAGMNSVPMVLVPQQAEQNLVAWRAQQLGVGLKLNKVSLERLREMAGRILKDDTFRQKAAMLGESLRCAGSYRRAADEVLAMVNTRA